jgi:hypothetical protein
MHIDSNWSRDSKGSCWFKHFVLGANGSDSWNSWHAMRNVQHDALSTVTVLARNNAKQIKENK